MRILSLAPLSGPGVDVLRALGEVTIDPWSDHIPFRLHAPDELTERLRGIDTLIVEADFVTAETLERSALRFLGVCRGDPNNIDVEAATKHGVAVIRTPGRNASAVADLTIGLMYALLRRILEADAEVRAGRWIVDGVLPQQRFGGRELASCVVGIVGCGAVGTMVAQRTAALGARTVGYDPLAHPSSIARAGIETADSLEKLFEQSDIVTLHAPLTDETRGLVDRKILEHAKPGMLLINTARYGLVDEPALLEALRDGRISGAAFDHFENEFLPTDHPLIAMKNVILTPHIGGTTSETVENHTMTIALGIAEVLEGKVPLSVVNPEVLSVARP